MCDSHRTQLDKLSFPVTLGFGVAAGLVGVVVYELFAREFPPTLPKLENRPPPLSGDELSASIASAAGISDTISFLVTMAIGLTALVAVVVKDSFKKLGIAVSINAVLCALYFLYFSRSMMNLYKAYASIGIQLESRFWFVSDVTHILDNAAYYFVASLIVSILVIAVNFFISMRE